MLIVLIDLVNNMDKDLVKALAMATSAGAHTRFLYRWIYLDRI